MSLYATPTVKFLGQNGPLIAPGAALLVSL